MATEGQSGFPQWGHSARSHESAGIESVTFRQTGPPHGIAPAGTIWILRYRTGRRLAAVSAVGSMPEARRRWIPSFVDPPSIDRQPAAVGVAHRPLSTWKFRETVIRRIATFGWPLICLR